MAVDVVSVLKDIWSNASDKEKFSWRATPVDATVNGKSITYTTLDNYQPSWLLDRYSMEKLKLRLGCGYSVVWSGVRVNLRPCNNSDTFVYLLDGSDLLLDNSVPMGEV